MKLLYLYMTIALAVLLNSSCSDEKQYPDTFDLTREYKSKLLGEWIPVEQQVLYYTKSYDPGRDTIVTFTGEDFNNISGKYYNGLYNLQVKVASSGTPIRLFFKEDQSYAFGENLLIGATFHVVNLDGKIMIDFVKNESATSSVKQIERMPYTIISLTNSELIIGTKSDAQESVFIGEYNVSTGLPVSQNRWCTHTITYTKK